MFCRVNYFHTFRTAFEPYAALRKSLGAYSMQRSFCLPNSFLSDLQRTGGRQSSRRSWVICEQSLHAPRESCRTLLPRVRTRSMEELFEAKLYREVCSLLAALLRNHPIVFLRPLCLRCLYSLMMRVCVRVWTPMVSKGNTTLDLHQG